MTLGATKKIRIWNELRILIQKFEPQDATNFVLTYFTMAVLQSISLMENLCFLWQTVPILSLFQIIRKPNSFKKFIRPIRVGLAPVSVILTWIASYYQIYDSGIFCAK